MKPFRHLTLALLTTAFISNGAVADEGKKATVFYYDLSVSFISTLKEKIDAEAKEAGLTLTEYNAAGDAMTQRSQLQAAVTADENAPLIVNLVDPRKAAEVVKMAKKTNRRVIFFNRQPETKMFDNYKYAWYVGADPVLAGDYQADLIVDYIHAHRDVDRNHDGIISVVMLKGEKEHQETAYRSNAVLRVLDQNNISYEVSYETYSDWSFRQGYDYMNINLSQNGLDKTELVIANNDTLALGAVRALNEHGYNDGSNGKYIPVFGIDAIPQALKAISDGTLTGTVINDAESMAETIVKLAISDEYQSKRLSKEIGYFINQNHTINIPYAEITR